MAEKIIYVQNPHTGEITGRKVDLAEMAKWIGVPYTGIHFRWYDDEAWKYVEANSVPVEDVEIPHHIYSNFGVLDPRISYTYSAAGAARMLGISRATFLLRLENHPLEAKGMHDGKPVYRWEDLVEWDKGIPAPGRPKNS